MSGAQDHLVSRRILGVRVDATTYEDVVRRCMCWARQGLSRYVCVSAVHAVMEAYDDPDFRRIVNEADLVTPDGMPLVWSLKLLGVRGATRVYGPQLTAYLIAAAARNAVPVGFYGGASPERLDRLTTMLQAQYPGLHVAYAYSPPFRPLSAEEDAQVVREITASGARILFVGLGCPKQGRWMAGHRGRIPATMVGVGAAFDFLAGIKPQAPRWVQAIGMEWCFRLLCEPRRLWKRYLKNNPRFVALFLLQLARLRRFPA